ncbi:hypothetical protein L2I63_03180 [Bacillus cereus]|uniref:hypothetical protein n=1 Tax=Bacillus cereus TaxID=1396 RepID=UPI0020CD9398|nr:hypothetical protein [Bacillus cereus]
MGLGIRNLNAGLKSKIKKCIALLDEEYQSLDFTIYFYEKAEKLEKEKGKNPDLKIEEYKQILQGEVPTAGITIGDQGKIKIFLFLFDDLKKNPNEVINLIGNLYHEIRHAWQFEKALFQDEEDIQTIDGNLETYYSLPSEKDAYKFQEEQMQKHWRRSLEIFGINTDGVRKDYEYKLLDEIREIIYS